MSDNVLAKIDAKIQETRSALKKLEEGRAAYLDIMQTFGSLLDEPPPTKPERTANREGITDAVLRMIRLYPNGITVPDFITIVEGQPLKTEAKNPKRTIRNTIDYLAEQKRITKRDGMLFPVPKDVVLPALVARMAG